MHTPLNSWFYSSLYWQLLAYSWVYQVIRYLFNDWIDQGRMQTNFLEVFLKISYWKRKVELFLINIHQFFMKIRYSQWRGERPFQRQLNTYHIKTSKTQIFWRVFKPPKHLFVYVPGKDWWFVRGFGAYGGLSF